ncbi:response regulator [Parvularcula oceani]|uniref:response regulator n=1 Tax=Parvularcula oceani TaxID=1247963 RepID=UPI0004E27CA3|nr:response regulator [Parvularcula oceani]
MPKRRVMIVEDEALIAEDMARTLRRGGYDILGPYSSEKKALNQIDLAAPDAALLDINLGPAADSYAIADRLKERALPFAFLSGYGSLRSERFSGERLLSKPCTPAALLETVAELISPSAG